MDERFPVDYHTHIGLAEHWGREFSGEATKMRSTGVTLVVDPDDHEETTRCFDKVIVLAFQSRLLNFCVPNDYVAEYVKRDPDRFIGFLSVDPNDPGAVAELERAHFELGLRGVKMSPIYQGFHPMDPRVLPIYAFAERHGLPLLLHQGTTFPRRAPLKYAHPEMLEDVALAFPELRIVIAHLGHPWEVETIALVRKHPHVYSDVSGLYYRPWQFYNSLMLCQEYGVMHKLVFGTDFPVTRPAEAIAGIRGVNRFVEGTRFPRIDPDAVEALLHRDILRELNLA